MTTKQRRGAAAEGAGSAEEPKRVERVLVRPMVQGGVERKPGETVSIWPHQVEWLEAEGYFEEANQ